ncbi:uncharacterized protein LY89DRAFT_472028 [Mollisia scopiformis]|uniref:Uncharacterized protein n=1 Tax=Mollisia scopiformis TaxID=149040 RepID=A0A194XK19_MOLSC|nr:uncharacterized protein LY89DRAFT_472028 [Mollisia scopiformis]KUJ20132.1 hypothetical protein LY89DRAFT_472028 [Mollisia scopiformis]
MLRSTSLWAFVLRSFEYRGSFPQHQSATYQRMAEFIAFASAAAAVTQLTGQILDAGAKIRSFWNNLQGAPKHVSDLLDDITGLARVINNMPEQENEMVRECCLKVKRIMDELLYQLNILRSDMEKSRKKVRVTWAKFKVVEKKRVLRELTERLEKAKSQLMIANSFYQTSMQANMMQEIIMLRVTLCSSIQTGGAQALNVSDLHGTIIESTTQIEEDAVSNSGGSPAPRAVTRRHRRRPQITIKTYWCGLGRVQKVCSRYDIDQEDEGLPDIEIEKRFLPNRFAAQMGLHGLGKKSSKVFGMWTHSLTPIRVVPDDVPIIQAVVLGDLEAVISLTEQRKATVFDMSERGYTLLHIAAAHFRPELCRWLIAHGLKGDLVDIELGRLGVILLDLVLAPDDT